MLRKILPAFLFPKDKPDEEPQESIAFNRKYGYNTSFGHVMVTWSLPSFREPSICTVVGFASVDTTRASASSMPVDITREVLFQPFSFEVNPTHPNQMWGVKRLVVLKPGRTVEPLCSACFAWDFSHARSRIPGSVEPSSCYYFAVVVDSEMLILFGDMPEWAYAVTQVREGPSAVLTRREDRVKLKGTSYNTSAIFGGVEREITINLTRGMLAIMNVEIDGRTAVCVESLFKMFRGTIKFDLSEGNLIQITWDLHDWLFGHANYGDDSEEEEEEEEPVVQSEKEDGMLTFSFIEQGVNTAHKTCPGNYVDMMRKEHGLSWGTLMEEWVSSEEERMHKGETFCFMVYLWKC
ncbi:uncharacterized protein LOC144553276 [Carex rostrata]